MGNVFLMQIGQHIHHTPYPTGGLPHQSQAWENRERLQVLARLTYGEKAKPCKCYL